MANFGYKAFNSNFTCRDYQFEVGKTYELPSDEKLVLCQSGFHYCKWPLDCDNYYIPSRFRYALIEALGEIVSVGDKCATNKMKIVKELTRSEFEECATGWHFESDRTVGRHYVNGILHRDKGPAIIFANGTLQFWHSGDLIRTVQPQFTFDSLVHNKKTLWRCKVEIDVGTKSFRFFSPKGIFHRKNYAKEYVLKQMSDHLFRFAQ
jgi:hypothetical protein